MRPIRPDRASVWAARRYSSLEGRVHATALDHIRGHWRVIVVQRWRHWEMWYPGNELGLTKAQEQRRNADALR